MSVKLGRNESLHHITTCCRHQLEQSRLLQGLQTQRQQLGGL